MDVDYKKNKILNGKVKMDVDYKKKKILNGKVKMDVDYKKKDFKWKSKNGCRL